MINNETIARRYISQPTEISAIRWHKGINDQTVKEFSVTSAVYYFQPRPSYEDQAEVFDYLHDTWVHVKDGQWIIRGTKEELYPCDDEVFKEKYAPLP